MSSQLRPGDLVGFASEKKKRKERQRMFFHLFFFLEKRPLMLWIHVNLRHNIAVPVLSVLSLRSISPFAYPESSALDS